MEFADYWEGNKKRRVSAIEVDSDPNNYIRKNFRCIFCGIQVAFSQGTSYPLFRRWKGCQHLSHCKYENIVNQGRQHHDNGDIELLVSTILPRAMAHEPDHTTPRGPRATMIAKHFSGKRTKLFISSVRKLLDPSKGFYFASQYENMQIITETNEQVHLKELLGAQDEIIDKIDNSHENAVVCIIKGNTRTAKITAGNHIRISLSTSGKHKNTKNFSLFIPSDFVSKNNNRLKEVEEAFVICYGIAEKNMYGYQMTIYSIYHQIDVVKKY